jgi:hypothetical protein
MNRISLVTVALAFMAVSAACEILPYPPVFTRPAGIGGAFVAVAGDHESAFFNPASAAFNQRLSVTFPYLGISIDNDLFSLLDYLSSNSTAFDKNDTTGIKNLAFIDTTLRRFDDKWFGLSWPTFSTSVFYRGFGVMARNTNTVEFMADRGLLFPFVVAQYGSMAELSLCYGRFFPHGVAAGMTVKLAVDKIKTVTVASNSVGKLDSSALTVSKADWRRGMGLDIGVTKALTRNSQAAFVWRDMGMSIKGEKYPNWSVGYSRYFLKREDGARRFIEHILLAADYADMLNAVFLTGLKMGGETAMNILPAGWLGLAVRGGIDGGYLTTGAEVKALKIVRLAYATYAEETGRYVGQQCRRVHLVSGQLSLRF